MLGRLADALAGAFDRPLRPATSADEALASELRAAFRRLPVADTTNALPSEQRWLSHMNRLRTLVLDQDPRAFLRWDVVTATMFVGSPRYVLTELRHLKRRADWGTRWRAALRESRAGHPPPFLFYPASSGNLIHHAYHLAQFEEKTGVRAQELDFVLEFGGGYGSMCRLFHNLGFRGNYVILDLPAFSALQIYYLKSLGLPVGTSIACVSDAQQLRIDAKNKLFIATWSISEVPLGLRNAFLPLVAGFESFLIAYQDRYGEVDNLEFFERWQATVANAAWQRWRIEHIPGNHHYLVGKAA